MVRLCDDYPRPPRAFRELHEAPPTCSKKEPNDNACQAIKADDVERLRFILDTARLTEVCGEAHSHGLLHIAAACNSVQCIKLLLARGWPFTRNVIWHDRRGAFRNTDLVDYEPNRISQDERNKYDVYNYQHRHGSCCGCDDGYSIHEDTEDECDDDDDGATNSRLPAHHNPSLERQRYGLRGTTAIIEAIINDNMEAVRTIVDGQRKRLCRAFWYIADAKPEIIADISCSTFIEMTRLTHDCGNDVSMFRELRSYGRIDIVEELLKSGRIVAPFMADWCLSDVSDEMFDILIRDASIWQVAGALRICISKHHHNRFDRLLCHASRNTEGVADPNTNDPDDQYRLGDGDPISNLFMSLSFDAIVVSCAFAITRLDEAGFPLPTSSPNIYSYWTISLSESLLDGKCSIDMLYFLRSRTDLVDVAQNIISAGRPETEAACGRILHIVARTLIDTATIAPRAQILLEMGADVNAKNYYGNTPLHCDALRMTQFDKPDRGNSIADLLVAWGADESIMNNEGQTAQQLRRTRQEKWWNGELLLMDREEQLNDLPNIDDEYDTHPPLEPLKDSNLLEIWGPKIR